MRATRKRKALLFLLGSLCVFSDRAAAIKTITAKDFEFKIVSDNFEDV